MVFLKVFLIFYLQPKITYIDDDGNRLQSYYFDLPEWIDGEEASALFTNVKGDGNFIYAEGYAIREQVTKLQIFS